MKRVRSMLATSAGMLVLLVGGVTYSVERARDHARVVQRTNERVRALDELEQWLLDAENGQRGYLLTADASYLEPYHAAVAGRGVMHQRVRGLGLDSEELVQLERLLTAEFEELAETIRRFDSAHQQRAAELVKRVAGKRTLSRLRARIRRLKRGQEERQLAALVSQRDRLDRNQLVAATGAILAFLIALMAQLKHNKELRDQVAQADRFRDLSELLTQQADQLKQSELELEARLGHQRELTTQLERHGESLERANHELDQFAYVASHDLKAPLRGIASLAAFIEADAGPQLDAESRDNLGLLQQRVKRMETLIEGLLTYARAGRRAELEDVDTRALCVEIVDMLNLEAASDVHVAEDLPTLRTERSPLQQVLMNLIENATKHAGGNGCRVEIFAELDAAGWRFSVRDHGPGIDPRFHQRVFGFFERLQSRDAVEGSGIGLAVVKKIVEERGGRVWVESELGAGATFHFLWREHPEDRARVANIAAGQNYGGAHA